jgi:predicted nucleic-acid-binding Zn-ribbon protein
MHLLMRCKFCGGAKFIGEEYYAFGEVWVDVTCIKCAHSKDIEKKKLDDFLEKLSKILKRQAQANAAK